MDPASAFSLGSLLAVVGWLFLLTGLFVEQLRRPAILAARMAIPVVLGAAYATLIFAGLGESSGGGFGSIEQVRALFESDAALAAGWLHYLAFDLFVGSWEVEDSRQRGVPALLLVPCLALTFLLGPIGLLLYLALRAAFHRRATSQEQPA